MKRFLFLLLSLSLGLNAGLLYVRYMERPHAGPMPGAPDHQRFNRPPPPAGVMIEQQLAVKTRHLGLDSAQQKAIRIIMEKHLPAMAESREKSRKANRRMVKLYADDPFDKVEFQRLMREASQARSKADFLSALILAEEASVLTIEQRSLFAETAPMAQGEGHRPPPPPRGRH
jgi:Spy/CpxP family protein refolding chaperone